MKLLGLWRTPPGRWRYFKTESRASLYMDCPECRTRNEIERLDALKTCACGFALITKTSDDLFRISVNVHARVFEVSK